MIDDLKYRDTETLFKASLSLNNNINNNNNNITKGDINCNATSYMNGNKYANGHKDAITNNNKVSFTLNGTNSYDHANSNGVVHQEKAHKKKYRFISLQLYFFHVLV